METEKTFYTLNHNGEESEEKKKTESYEPLEDDVAVETDKMLIKATPDERKSTEILAEADETTALEEKTEAIKDEKPNSVPSVPAKNRFLQFFERKKNNTEPSESQNGNTVSPTVKDVDGAPATNPKRRFIPLKLQNPFAKKSENGTTPVPEKPTVEASSSDDKNGKSLFKT